MKSLISLRHLAALGLFAGLFAGSASAQVDTATMTVTASVAPSCELQLVDNMAFGTLDQTTDNQAQADITWVCTSGNNSEIRLDGGSSGDITSRAMGGSGSLPYQLFTDAARSQVFGDGTSGNAVAVTGTGYGNPSTITVYGQVDQADAAAAAAGDYLDTINVTILF